MTSEKDPLEGAVVEEPGTGADAVQDVFVEGEAVGPGEEFKALPPPPNANLITPQQFYDTMFKGLFAAPKLMNPIFAPIAIQESEEVKARQASDSAYALLLVWYPAMLKPGSETMGHFLMMVPFLMLKFKTIHLMVKMARTPPPTRNETNGEKKE